jgi:hypothetical protein
MADQRTPSTAEIVIMASGGVALIGSFLDYRYDSSLWSSGFLPAGTLMAVFATLMAVVVALRFANVSLPAAVAGFSLNQIHLILGFFAALYALAFLVVEGGGREVGTWFVTIGCIGAFVGAILLSKEGARPSTGGTPPPTA